MNRSLAVVYTFMPYTDTAGIVFAKRIQAQYREDFTVICCKNYKSAETPKDSTLELIGKPYVTEVVEVDSKFTWREWIHFCDFISKSVNIYKEELGKGVEYKKVYSRSMSVVTHLVAYEIKRISPEIEWIAEFSDPLLKDITGEDRTTLIPDSWIKDHIKIDDVKVFRQYNNLFSLSEVLCYLYADSIVFTNTMQKSLMIDYVLDELIDLNFKRDLLDTIERKSIISPHPTLSSDFYKHDTHLNDFDDSLVNIAFFGYVHPQRSFSYFFKAWSGCTSDDRSKFRFYIFTNENIEVIKKSIPENLRNYVTINKGLEYLKFLGALKRFDYLLSVDTEVKILFGLNPYLPSKLSDYFGSETKVLALVEDGSPTDKLSNPMLVKYSVDGFSSADFSSLKYRK